MGQNYILTEYVVTPEQVYILLLRTSMRKMHLRLQVDVLQVVYGSYPLAQVT